MQKMDGLTVAEVGNRLGITRASVAGQPPQIVLTASAAFDKITPLSAPGLRHIVNYRSVSFATY